MKRKIALITVLALLLTLCATGVFAATPVTSETELRAALAGTEATITLGGNFTVDDKIVISRGVTIDGGGYSISPSANFPANTSVIEIAGVNTGLTLKSLIVDGKNPSGTIVSKHGINVWNSTGVSLENVTSRNNGAAGLVVASAEVTANGLTTSGNAWGGVNVGASSAAGLPAPVFTVATDGYDGTGDATGIYVDGDEGAKANDYVQGLDMETVTDDNGNTVSLVKGTVTRGLVVKTAAELLSALADPNAGLITLGANIAVDYSNIPNYGVVPITRPVVIDGASYTLSAGANWPASSSNVNLINIASVSSGAVEIKNLAIDGGSVVKHGINAYMSNAVTATNVTSQNNYGTGLMVQSSIVTVNALTTNSNGWGGVNIDKGTTTTAPKLILSGSGYTKGANETTGIYIDENEFTGTQEANLDAAQAYVDMSAIGTGSLVFDAATNAWIVKFTPNTTPSASVPKANPNTGVTFN